MVEESDNKLLENYSSISRLTALKPRQVVLAEQRQLQKHKPGETMTKQELNQKTHILKDDHKLALLHSVIKYIHNKGFVKTFKRFLKEAQLEDDTWKANAFDLEEMYCKHLENCRNGDTNSKGHMEQEESANGTMVKDPGGDKGAPVETVSKKKKKKNEENDENAKSTFSEVKMDDSVELTDKKKKKKNKLTSESHDENGMREDSLPAVTERKQGTEIAGGDGKNDSAKTTKSKDKVKEGKPRMVFPVEDGKETQKVVVSSTDAANILLDHNKTESKEKKKKKKVSDSEKLSDIGVEVFDKEKSQETKEIGADKKSKKRKRTASDESKDKPLEGVAVEESKRRKAEGTEEADVNTPQAEVKPLNGADLHVGGESNQENGSVSQMKPQKSSTKQFDGSEKGDLVNNGVERSSDKRSAKKQRFDSAEPKTVNAFQRVKVDEVEFADNKLQDNSYWAKGGADIGYGAKAQEVLGQVKGRDFRHEKTKKKRGSYRGGQIDLQSHSVKFNYPDEE